MESDFEPTVAMFREADVTRYIGGALDRADVWTRFLRDCGHWSLMGFGQLTIIEKASGAYVGKTGLARSERDLGPSADTSVECSWTLRSAFQGQGYAREAASAALGWYDSCAGGPTACLIDEANVASLKLASFLGYFEVDRLTRLSGRAVVFRRDSPAHEQNSGISVR
ncbi:MAG: GNAT family N-acetyltransferase [Loktanella sp.]|nr:GNAT family N-acetyltransferase [Loktanella sp.]